MSGINLKLLGHGMGQLCAAASEEVFSTDYSVEAATGMSSNLETYTGPAGP